MLHHPNLSYLEVKVITSKSLCCEVLVKDVRSLYLLNFESDLIDTVLRQLLLLSLLAHLELCSRSAYAMACCPSSIHLSFVIHLSLPFHIFDISSRTISWIELKLSGRHCGNMEIQNC